MIVRVLYRQDGGVSVIYPAPQSQRKSETETAWLQRVFAKATPKGVEYKDIDTDVDPLPDKKHRTCWVKGTSGSAVAVDMAKYLSNAAEQEKEAMIQAKIREMAEAELVAEGKLEEK